MSLRCWIFLLTGFLVFGCTESKEETDDVISNPVVIDLYGTWRSSCYDIPDGTESLTIAVNESSFRYRIQRFPDNESCEPSAMKLEIEYTFSPQGAVLLEKPQYAKTVDLIVRTVTAKATDAQWNDQFNTQGTCGATDWVLNLPKNISGTNCFWPDGIETRFPNAAETLFDVYSVGGSPLTLQFGNRLAPVSGLRPESYDDSLTFYYLKN